MPVFWALNMVIEALKSENVSAAAKLEAAYLDTAWSEKQIEEARLREDTLYLSATEDGKLCAVASCVFSAYEAMVENVAVAEDFRRRGIGKDLMKAIEDEAKARSLEQISLEVASRNTAATELYKKMGFSVAGVRKNFYRRQNDDGLVMIKEI